MDRGAWLRERRDAVVRTYDGEGPTYDEVIDPIQPMHVGFIDRLLATTPPDGVVLDVPCGTGRYFEFVTRAGRRVVGADQSAGMLASAEAKGLATALHRVGLQEMRFDGEFDATMTIDSIENVPPEDWPTVLANLRRAVRPGGHHYLTVEEIDQAEIDAGFAAGSAAGLPIVPGEVIEGDVAGYHFYPGRDRALAWFADAGLEVVAEDRNWQGDYGYRHYLLRPAGRA
ncbi:MAG TPA: class I SAM-dependent methyltransferase [Candidatus Limnocylindrales bacterium]|jgi:cyclopropane fatty-acyl-phospholipid synthase-like methyltransferase